MRNLLMLGLLVVAALSGCIGDETGTEGGHDDGHDAETPSGAPIDTEGTDTQTSVNTAPTAVIDASGDGLNASEGDGPTWNVTVPANVTFDIDFADEDGDDLSWTLDVDGDSSPDAEGTAFADNGTYPAAEFTTSYTEAGEYNITLSIADANATFEATALLIAVAPASTEPAFTPIEETGTVDFPCLGCGGTADGSVSFQTGVQGFDLLWYELPAEAAGQPFSVESTGGDPDVILYDTCGGSAVGDYQADGPESGTIPSGAGCIYVYEFETPDSTITTRVG